jgi:leucyl aminopeptidase
MGSLLGVAQGSAQVPVMIVVRYEPKGEPSSETHLGLVGKAVTFDTGGISIKPSAEMDRMKYDMAGGAAMLGAMLAIARLKPSVRVTAVVPSVENMPGANAQRPGDIVKTLSGKTVEVLNTDAEGRLILCDALTYAQSLGCNRLVDAATLTGSIVVALGHERTGLFANDADWSGRVQTASEAAGEKMWPMPLDDEYKKQLESPIADLANIGTRWGGSITAAVFLKAFADPTPWAHLDIAGTAWIDQAEPDAPKGPTGVGVRTMVELAMGL